MEWVYVRAVDVWQLWDERGAVVGGIEGETVRQWPAERMGAWLSERGLPPLP